MRLLADCLDNALKKEQEIPKIILQCLEILTGEDYSLLNNNFKKKMRSREDIMKDYGLA